jgi:hypothetical protein
MPGVLQLIRQYERRRHFWREVDVGGPEDHWPWLGDLDRHGTPVYRGRPANEVAYDLARGPRPRGSRLVRRCDDPRCVNPEHMNPEHVTGHPESGGRTGAGVPRREE